MRDKVRELEQVDPLLHSAVSISVNKSEITVGVSEYREVLTRIEQLNRNDVQLMVSCMEDNPALQKFWTSTIHRLNAEQFSLYCERVEGLWERMTLEYEISPKFAWTALLGYLDGDPGTKRSHANAVFMINAAVLQVLSSLDEKKGNNALAIKRREAPHDYGMHWNTEELSPEMITFAIERAADIDRIMEIILRHHMWQPEAITCHLDGELPIEGSEATVLAHTLINELHANADAARVNVLSGTLKGQFSERELIKTARRQFQNAVQAYSELRKAEDAEALRLHLKLVPSSATENSGYYRKSLEMLINDLRAANQKNLDPIIDTPMLKRFGKASSALEMERIQKNTGFYQDESDTVRLEARKHALRTAVALGSKEVIEYLSDNREDDVSGYAGAVALAAEYGVTDYKELIGLVESRIEHGALGNGVL